ncbi:MAG TPA: hypothetical protein VH682_14835 [Gemmataceae bacterium]|jgi:predicted Zn finger-like uncharacterized protein
MPQIITCPDCERKLRVPDNLLGKKVRCPSCSVLFKAAAAETGAEESTEEPEAKPSVRRRPAVRDERYADSPRSSRRRIDEEEEEDDRPRRRRDEIDEEEDDRPRRRRNEEDEDEDEERSPSLHDQKVGWNKVRIGINLVMIGIWVWLAGVVLGGLGVLLGFVLVGSALFAGGRQAGLTSLGFGGVILLLAVVFYYLCLFAELVLRLVGYGLCMAVPPRRESGLKPLAITTFSLAGVYVVFSLLNIVVSGFTGFASSLAARSGGNAAGTGLALVGGLCAIASFIVFLFFLRSVCNNARARDQASKPIAVLIAFVCFWAVVILIGTIMLCAGGFALAKAVQSQSGSNVAGSMGVWLVIFIVVACLLGLVYLGLQVWYVMVLQKIRDAVASYRRRL